MSGKYTIGLIGLVAGIIAGFVFANAINRGDQNFSSAPAAVAGQSATGGDAMSDVSNALGQAEREPGNFVAQMKAGDMHARIGRFDSAAEYYRKGIALQPNDARAYVVLGNVLFDSGKFEEAAGSYEKALELEPNDANARTDLAATFVERPAPDLPRALAELEKALKLAPKSEPALYYLGVVHARRGDAAAARRALAQLKEASSNGELARRLDQLLAAK